MQKTQAPLSGIRVIDFGHYIAGPLTGMLLADQGAEVIKVDRPGSSESHSPETSVYNRNKKRLELDLKRADDLATAQKLIQSADVVIENFRPGVMGRLGLDAETLASLHPWLVYLSLPGFAATDAERASIRAFEGVVCAATGLYTDLQVMRRLVDSRPIYTPIALGSTYGAIHGAIAVTLALYNREKTGSGDVIEVPLTGAAMSAMAIINLVIENQPQRFGMPSFTEEERTQIPHWRQQVAERGEQAMQEIGQSLAGMGSPATGTLRAGDGKWLYYIAGGHSRNTRALLMTLGLYDELIAEGMVDLPVYGNLHRDNNLPDSSGWSREWNRKILQKMQTVISTQPASHWVERLTDVGVPAAVHRSAHDWLHAPETATAALTVEVDDPTFGKVRQIGVQVWLASTEESYMQPKPVEDMSEADLSALLATIQTHPQSEKKPGQRTPILEGIRVLDLSNVLAGPASARTLAEYGAEVIKIDPPDPNFGPTISCKFPIEVSPGKRSMILDINVEEGRKIFYEMVKTADVIVHNFRPGVPARIGIDYKHIKVIKPDIVYLNLTAFNGPRPGPWMERPGFDPLLQAATGIQMRYGGDGQPPVLHGWASCIDYITGYSATFGAALALLARTRSGAGDYVTTSLAQGAQLVQAPLLIGAGDHQPGHEVQGQKALGEHALYRIYQARDGWLFLAGLQEDQDKLKSVPELRDVDATISGDDEQLASWLEARLRNESVDRWVSAFHEVGLGAHRVDSLFDVQKTFMHEGTTQELQESWDDGRSISWVRFKDHPAGGAVELAPPAYARLRNAPVQLLAPNPKQGSHTREVLLEMGYSNAQIEQWLADGVVKEQLHDEYLPG